MNATIKTATKARRIQELLIAKADRKTGTERVQLLDAAKLLETEAPVGRWLAVKSRASLQAQLVALATS
ncbi:MAG: hypothetical protein O7A04_03470 [Acidobacteria bacterium]|nr:hypothetical protein [Acidobacteriota bacterium]